MPSRTECQTIEFAGGNTYIFDKPVKKYIVDFGEYADMVEATNMNTTDLGIVFENVIIRTNNGACIGIGRTFIEHGQLVGVTLIEEEFGGIVITNETKLGLFSVINDG
jgi:hypothetical protein